MPWPLRVHKAPPSTSAPPRFRRSRPSESNPSLSGSANTGSPTASSKVSTARFKAKASTWPSLPLGWFHASGASRRQPQAEFFFLVVHRFSLVDRLLVRPSNSNKRKSACLWLVFLAMASNPWNGLCRITPSSELSGFSMAMDASGSNDRSRSMLHDPPASGIRHDF